MIWLALLIPLFAVILLAWKFPKRMHITEYMIVFVVPIICIVVGKGCSVHSQTKDMEYWNSYGITAIYEEEWKEKWTEIETYTTTDSKGNTQTHTRTVTKRRTHPEKWTLQDNIGKSHSISKTFFDRICKIWDNKTFKDMQRHRSTHTITKDGDAYVTIYNKQFETTIPICTKHSYENRIQCSKSVFNFQKVTAEEKVKYDLVEYPKENRFGFNPILGYKNTEATLRLQKYNALNGFKKQLHMMILVFDGQPLEAGLFQESYWKGGNKNEFVICVGTKDNNIKWVKVISWTEQEDLKIKTVRHIKEMKIFDAVKVVDYMGEHVTKQFVRKEFADFSYIAVRPTTKAIIITFIITIIVTLIISFIVVLNGCNFKGNNNYRYRRY